MAKTNLEFKIMKTKQFEAYFDVKDRQARRKKAEMLLKLGLFKGDPIYFPAFCLAVKKPEEAIRNFFGW
jgi:cephalosporin-C deacetylase-like acetyl esterase